MEADQKFVEEVVKAIVNNPDKVKTNRIIDERGVLITLDVDPSDMGYVIGRSGQTARALRVLLKIVGAKNNARVNLKINEPEGGRGPGAGRMQSAAGAMPMQSPQAPIDTSAVDDLGI
ncbi:MAG: KH domain-containing protein [Candidatus Magasanikbacteria bacterium]|nr:KH domain-containing protein [Candidatus Magasanikbacteria bacterium]